MSEVGEKKYLFFFRSVEFPRISLVNIKRELKRKRESYSNS